MSTGATHLRLRIFLCVACICVGVALLLFFRLPSHRVVDSSGDAYAVGVPAGTAALVQQVLLTGPGRVTSAEVLLSKPAEAAGVPSGVVRVFDKAGRQVAQAPVPAGPAFERQYVTLEVMPALRLTGRSWLYVSVSAGDAPRSPDVSAWLNPRLSIGAQFEVTGAAEGGDLPAALATAQQRPGALCVRVSGLGPRSLALEWLLRIAWLLAFLLLAAAVWGYRAVFRWWRAAKTRSADAWRRVDERFERSWLGALGRRLSENHLIRVDLKVQAFCLAGLLAFVVLVGLSVHYSSIEMWNAVLPSDVPGKSDSSLVAGRAKSVRGDEWNAETPGILNKYTRPTGLTTQERAADAVSPWNWGFHVLGLERGFSFMWNFWVLGSVYAVFLLVMLLSGNRFGLSLFLSVLLLFSSYNRWWGVATEIATLASLLTAAIYFLQSRKLLNVTLATVVLFLFGLRFVLRLYPAWQVSVGYLMVFVLVGYVLRSSFRQNLAYRWKTRAVLGALLAVAGGAALSVAYFANRESLRAMVTTVYPGERVSTGGDVTFYHFFSGYLDPLFSEGRTFLWNICESSGFILLFPFVIALLLVERIYARRRISALIWALVAYVLILGVYMMVGFGEPLSRATLLSFVPGNRAVFAMGLASVLLTGLFIATPRVTEVPRWLKIATIPVSLGLFVAFAYGFRAAFDFPLSGFAVVICVALSVAVGALAFRARAVFYAVMLALVVLPSVWTNPVASGLDPIYGKRLVAAVQRAAAQEPDKRWLAYGDRYIPEITRAAGADVYNGVTWPPEEDTLARLDPGRGSEEVWNRFAHVECDPMRPGEPTFTLLAEDAYALQVSPSDPALADGGIGFFVVPDGQAGFFPPGSFRRVTPEPLNGYLIFESLGS